MTVKIITPLCRGFVAFTFIVRYFSSRLKLQCFLLQEPGEGKINKDLPSCWECPKCYQGKDSGSEVPNIHLNLFLFRHPNNLSLSITTANVNVTNTTWRLFYWNAAASRIENIVVIFSEAPTPVLCSPTVFQRGGKRRVRGIGIFTTIETGQSGRHRRRRRVEKRVTEHASGATDGSTAFPETAAAASAEPQKGERAGAPI